MDVGAPRCWNGSPVLVSAALVDPQRGGQTTLSASQVAVGSKRLRIVELGTPYKRPMSSSGRLSVDVMMMMMTAADEINACLKSSNLWRYVKKLQLTTNMRVTLLDDTSAEDFLEQLLTIGNGQVPVDESSALI
ncbi:jg141 [Pararge aegeria aegeria]|uniref:ATP-dependent DNA helicase n=1 Tax=Pararge aegeria aegeria TaxID=348720 RepID=A0A8S4QR23_9NEOP|nr:jg141 [Pararge aegeria aegeria]